MKTLTKLTSTCLAILVCLFLSANLTSCTQGGEEEVTEEAEVSTEHPTQLAEHVCNDHCTDEGCHFLHGEKDHVCGSECHAGHEHPEGEAEEVSSESDEG